ncbi:MAG TPA: peroxiredoxin [Thermoplasmata archaeon]|nr:peroxiredoxin [Thermoplasmata archaeon]
MPTVGESAPEFTAPTQTGQPLSLAQLKGHPVVLYFYPQADTTGCTIEAKGFRDAYADFRTKGVHVVGVSVDPVEDQAAFAGKYALPFPLIADTEKTVARAYGVLNPAGRARRVTFLIDAGGRIAKVIESRDAAGHVADARAALL